MERFAIKELAEWKKSPYRKPLILKGIRQAGKTWLLKEFGKQFYDNIAYFNFDENVEYKEFFQLTKDPKRIIQNLTFASGQEIQPEKTLIIFDEIQDCSEVINSLKYFCENSNEYHVACAGSLLGITLSQPTSFPVGKVDFLNIFPMSFCEFLKANGDKNLFSYMESINSIEPIPSTFYNQLQEKLKMYYITGGMPEAVKMWTECRSVNMVQNTLNAILEAYNRDFAKHLPISDYPKISLIWKSIPSQLAKENKKFLYKAVKEGARAREYENALQWLCETGIVSKICRNNKPSLPISAYDDLSAFKIYVADVGILRQMSKLHPSVFTEGNRLFSEFKGALTENAILQAITNQYDVVPRYWSQNNPPYEVDFIIQHENFILPIEVKSDENVTSKSLNKYAEIYKDDIKLKIRFSLKNLKLDGDTLNIPLFMADYCKKIISIALNRI